MATIVPQKLSIHYDKVSSPDKPWHLKISWIDEERPKWVDELIKMAFATFVDALAEILIRWALNTPIAPLDDWGSEIGNVRALAAWMIEKFPEGDLGVVIAGP